MSRSRRQVKWLWNHLGRGRPVQICRLRNIRLPCAEGTHSICIIFAHFEVDSSHFQRVSLVLQQYFPPFFQWFLHSQFKETMSQDFLLLVCFFMNQFPPAPEYPIRTVSDFCKNLRRYSQVKVHHRYQRHRGKFATSIMTPASNFATSYASVVNTGGKFATGVNNTDGK